MIARHALVLNYILINAVAAGLLIAAWFQGWLTGFAEPTTWIMSLAICAVFLWGLADCGLRIWQLNRSLNEAGTGNLVADETGTRTLQMQLGNQIGNVRYVANSLVFLGLIGTVIGFIIGLSGVNAAAASDVEKVAPMITKLVNGMSVALYTTLLGAILNVWLSVNVRLLTTGSVKLLTTLAVPPSSAPAAAPAE